MSPSLVGRIPCLAVVAVLGSSPGQAQSDRVGPEVLATSQPRMIGVETGEPEKDSFGVEGGGGPVCRPVFSTDARQLGPQLGEPEKDSVGHEMLGQEDCGPGPRP